MLRFLYARAEAVVCVSEKMKEELIRNYRIDPTVVHVLITDTMFTIQCMSEETCSDSFTLSVPPAESLLR